MWGVCNIVLVVPLSHWSSWATVLAPRVTFASCKYLAKAKWHLQLGLGDTWSTKPWHAGVLCRYRPCFCPNRWHRSVVEAATPRMVTYGHQVCAHDNCLAGKAQKTRQCAVIIALGCCSRLCPAALTEGTTTSLGLLTDRAAHPMPPTCMQLTKTGSYGVTKSLGTPLDYGAGHVDMFDAMHPGLGMFAVVSGFMASQTYRKGGVLLSA